MRRLTSLIDLFYFLFLPCINSSMLFFPWKELFVSMTRANEIWYSLRAQTPGIYSYLWHPSSEMWQKHYYTSFNEKKVTCMSKSLFLHFFICVYFKVLFKEINSLRDGKSDRLMLLKITLLVFCCTVQYRYTVLFLFQTSLIISSNTQN